MEDSASGRLRYAVEFDSTPVEGCYHHLAGWYEELSDWLDSRLEA
jgi:hypothetical protein